MPTVGYNSKLLIDAAQQGNVDEIRRLIPLSDQNTGYGKALRVAAANGQALSVELLIPASLLKYNTHALHLAAEYGHTDCLKLLLPVSDPKSNNSYALCMSARNGHMDCVKHLLPVSNPKDRGSMPLQYAVANAHQQCVDILWDVSEPQDALSTMQHDYPNNPEIWAPLEQRIEAERLNRVLNDEIGATVGVKISRKM